MSSRLGINHMYKGLPGLAPGRCRRRRRRRGLCSGGGRPLLDPGGAVLRPRAGRRRPHARPLHGAFARGELLLLQDLLCDTGWSRSILLCMAHKGQAMRDCQKFGKYLCAWSNLCLSIQIGTISLFHSSLFVRIVTLYKSIAAFPCCRAGD